MEKVSDMEMIQDIQRIAHELNTNSLSLSEYLNHGGKYSAELIDDYDTGGFANKCSIAGIKVIAETVS